MVYGNFQYFIFAFVVVDEARSAVAVRVAAVNGMESFSLNWKWDLRFGFAGSKRDQIR